MKSRQFMRKYFEKVKLSNGYIKIKCRAIKSRAYSVFARTVIRPNSVQVSHLYWGIYEKYDIHMLCYVFVNEPDINMERVLFT